MNYYEVDEARTLEPELMIRNVLKLKLFVLNRDSIL